MPHAAPAVADAPARKPKRKGAVMREASTRKIYDVQSRVYDKTFGKLVDKRVRRAVTQLRVKPGETVLDLGVGTGNSLRYFPREACVVGIDLSFGMLRKAKDKLGDGEHPHSRLCQADALTLPFGDSTFDHVFISHVISVVSDPVAVVREMQRVAKPGARMVMLNHFQSSNPIVGKVEKLISPLCTKIGWRSDLKLSELLGPTGLVVEYRYKLTTPDIWETVVLKNDKPA